MDNEVHGKCQCGAVRFRISGEFESFFLCHCGRCRKDSGTAHSANLFSSTAEITWMSGAENIRVFRVPGTQHVKSFCADCGSALPFCQAHDGSLVVPAGSLDSPLEIRPTAHICVFSRANWDNDLASIERHDGLPGRSE